VILVSVDPGLRHLGFAVFTDGTLTHAALIKNPVKQDRGPTAWWGMADTVVKAWDDLTRRAGQVVRAPHAYVLEVPQVYRFGKSKGDPDDLIQLAGVGGAVGAALLKLPAPFKHVSTAHGYYPREWKGQTPKEIMLERIEERLTAEEKASIQPCAPSLRHNIIDSVGIGLCHLGRL
jgi:hypothetical protein